MVWFYCYCVYICGQMGSSWQPYTRSSSLLWLRMYVCVCVCVRVCLQHQLLNVACPLGSVDTVGAKFTINNHHEWKMGLISDGVCVCAHMLPGLFIVVWLAGWAKCHYRGDQVHVPQEPWVPALCRLQRTWFHNSKHAEIKTKPFRSRSSVVSGKTVHSPRSQ